MERKVAVKPLSTPIMMLYVKVKVLFRYFYHDSIVSTNCHIINLIFCLCSPGADIKAKTVNAYGLKSASFATIQAYSIRGFGSYSLAKAIIDSDGISTVNVELYGHYAGKKATIICRVGSDCRVDCRSNGCKTMKYICLPGANCGIQPAECNVNSKVDDVDCPIWTTSLASNRNVTDTEYETEENELIDTEKEAETEIDVQDQDDDNVWDMESSSIESY